MLCVVGLLGQQLASPSATPLQSQWSNNKPQFPRRNPTSQAGETNMAGEPSGKSHVLPYSQRKYAGTGWLIPHDTYNNYVTTPIRDADKLCQAQGSTWRLAEQQDIERIEPLLKQAGQQGYFWTGPLSDERHPLTYLLRDNGSSSFLSINVSADHHRNVLCVDA